jgi:DNA-binding MarR family transcriptional regulator
VSHPRTRLDGLIHQPVRFSLMAAVAKADELEFRFLRDALGVSDSVLSRQVSTLEEAGYVSVRKGYVGKRPRTWLSLTDPGRKVFEEHVQALRQIVDAER